MALMKKCDQLDVRLTRIERKFEAIENAGAPRPAQADRPLVVLVLLRGEGGFQAAGEAVDDVQVALEHVASPSRPPQPVMQADHGRARAAPAARGVIGLQRPRAPELLPDGGDVSGG
jgi:hypothetical protein